MATWLIVTRGHRRHARAGWACARKPVTWELSGSKRKCCRCTRRWESAGYKPEESKVYAPMGLEIGAAFSGREEKNAPHSAMAAELVRLRRLRCRAAAQEIEIRRHTLRTILEKGKTLKGSNARRPVILSGGPRAKGSRRRASYRAGHS